MAVINDEKDFDTFRGKLRGKFVLATAMRDVPAHFEAPGHRYTDAELADLRSSRTPARGRGGRGNLQATQDFNRKRKQFWIDEGVAAVLDISRGDGGTLFVQGGGSRDPKDPPRRRRCRSRSSTTAASRARSRRRSRSRCRWTSTTASTTPT